ncbi:hypothetical protein GCM10027344_06890 [Spelaeicoccus albus]
MAPWAILSARATAQFGPHTAIVEVTASNILDVDLGPLGTIEMPLPQVPGPLGVHVQVEEIEADLSAVNKPSTMDDLSSDVQSYSLFFADPDAQIDRAVREVVRDVVFRDVVGALALTAAAAGLSVLVGRARRDEIRGRLRRRPKMTAGGIAAAAVVALVAGVLTWPSSPAPFEGDPLFAGTPLEGARVTGRFSSIVDRVGGTVVDYYDANEKFYAKALSNLNDELASEPAAMNALNPPPSSTSSPSPGGIPDPDETPLPNDIATFLIVSDIHCNVGMSRIIGRVAGARQVDAVLAAGDATMTGTPTEKYCVDSMTKAIPHGISKVWVKGNHDSAATVDEEKKAGVTVLEGKAVTVDGIRIIGDADPRRTIFGQGTKRVGKETVQSLSARMADTTCRAAKPIDLLLIHDPLAGAATTDKGCVPLQISGHWHRRVGPEQVGKSIRYVNSTTGGARANALTPGPLKMDAEMTLFRFDKSTGRALDYQLITVHPDRSVTIAPWKPVPGIAPGTVKKHDKVPEPVKSEGSGG